MNLYSDLYLDDGVFLPDGHLGRRYIVGGIAKGAALERFRISNAGVLEVRRREFSRTDVYVPNPLFRDMPPYRPFKVVWECWETVGLTGKIEFYWLELDGDWRHYVAFVSMGRVSAIELAGRPTPALARCIAPPPFGRPV